MKILFVAPWIPSSIRPRSLGILRELADHHDVWFIGQISSSERLKELDQLPLAGVKLVTVGKWPGMLRALGALFTGSSLQASFVRSPRFRKALRELLLDIGPDAVHFNVIRSAAFLDDVAGIPLVFDLDELRSEYYEQLARHSSSLIWRAVGRLEARRMRQLERRVLARSDYTFVSSPVDVDEDSKKVLLLRSPVAVEHLEEPGSVPTSANADSPVILFVGRMSYRANVEAIVSFVKDVMPLVRADCPRAQLWIAGENPGPDISKLQSPDVRVLGFVEDLGAVYRQATLGIVPVELGTGVQMKLIQSMGAGLPTVVTADAARRAGLETARHVLVAGNAREWADAIARLISDPGLSSAIASEGKTWFATHYAPDELYASLRTAYGQIATGAVEVNDGRQP